jgi:hypothetical protein
MLFASSVISRMGFQFQQQYAVMLKWAKILIKVEVVLQTTAQQVVLFVMIMMVIMSVRSVIQQKGSIFQATFVAPLQWVSFLMVMVVVMGVI